MADIHAVCSDIQASFQKASEAGTSGPHAKLADELTVLEGLSRESMQEKTTDDINAVIKKLKTAEPLSQSEHELTRVWLVGDAEYYAKLENNFGDWTAELKRLVGEVGRIGSQAMDFKAALHLRAIVKDAIRTNWDIHHYLEQKERVERFDESTKSLDREERNTLIEVLQRKMSSADF